MPKRKRTRYNRRKTEEKGLEFRKIEEKCLNFLYRNFKAITTEKKIDELSEEILNDVRSVKGQALKEMAMCTLGAIVGHVYGARSDLAWELRNGDAPGKLCQVMMNICTQMSEESRSAFLRSDKGLEWKENLRTMENYRKSEEDPHIKELVDLFEKKAQAKEGQMKEFRRRKGGRGRYF